MHQTIIRCPVLSSEYVKKYFYTGHLAKINWTVRCIGRVVIYYFIPTKIMSINQKLDEYKIC